MSRSPSTAQHAHFHGRDPSGLTVRRTAACRARRPWQALALNGFMDAEWTTGTNNIQIKVVGSKILVRSNGQTMLRYDDTTDPITYGGVGVGEIWGTNGWFDNMVVRSAS